MKKDVIYFGHLSDEDARESMQSFVDTLLGDFTTLEYKPLHDEDKGFHIEVYYPDRKENQYLAWLIARGWSKVSFTYNITIYSMSEKELQYIRRLAYKLFIKPLPTKSEFNDV